MGQVRLIFPDDPIAVLAGDREPMHHHRLAAAQDRTRPACVKRFGELVVNQHRGQSLQ
jgi:hypothetical protein